MCPSDGNLGLGYCLIMKNAGCPNTRGVSWDPNNKSSFIVKQSRTFIARPSVLTVHNLAGEVGMGPACVVGEI